MSDEKQWVSKTGGCFLIVVMAILLVAAILIAPHLHVGKGH
jgi:hypothetical protein